MEPWADLSACCQATGAGQYNAWILIVETTKQGAVGIAMWVQALAVGAWCPGLIPGIHVLKRKQLDMMACTCNLPFLQWDGRQGDLLRSMQACYCGVHSATSTAQPKQRETLAQNKMVGEKWVPRPVLTPHTMACAHQHPTYHTHLLANNTFFNKPGRLQ